GSSVCRPGAPPEVYSRSLHDALPIFGGIIVRMSQQPDNRPDPNYREKLAEAARTARDWDGPIVVLTHVDADGDAIGSCLALTRRSEEHTSELQSRENIVYRLRLENKK